MHKTHPRLNVRGQRRLAWSLVHCALCLWQSAPAAAQQLVDRLVARVDGYAITLTDVQAARALGVVQATTDEEAVQQLVNRQLLLAEVARFPPPEPPAAFVNAQLTRERTAAGARLPEVMQATGLDEQRLRDIARDTIRIQSYIDERFGTALQVTDDEAEAYYDAHPDEFRRAGALIPFDEALPAARERANAERRRTAVDRWLQDLRGRADIAIAQPSAVTP